jgi:hypothetical protein
MHVLCLKTFQQPASSMGFSHKLAEQVIVFDSTFAVTNPTLNDDLSTFS